MSDLSRHGALLRFPLIGETTGYRLWVAGTRNRVYQDSFFRGDEPAASVFLPAGTKSFMSRSPSSAIIP